MFDVFYQFVVVQLDINCSNVLMFSANSIIYLSKMAACGRRSTGLLPNISNIIHISDRIAILFFIMFPKNVGHYFEDKINAMEIYKMAIWGGLFYSKGSPPNISVPYVIISSGRIAFIFHMFINNL